MAEGWKGFWNKVNPIDALDFGDDDDEPSEEEEAEIETDEAEERTDEQYDAISEHIAETYPQMQMDIQEHREQYDPLKEQLQKTIDTGEGPELRKYLQQRQIGEERMKSQISQGARDSGVSPGDYIDRMTRALSLKSGETTQGASDVAGFASQEARKNMMNILGAEQNSLGLEANVLGNQTGAMGVGGGQAWNASSQAYQTAADIKDRKLTEQLAWMQFLSSLGGSVAGAVGGGAGGGGIGAGGMGLQSSGLNQSQSQLSNVPQGVRDTLLSDTQMSLGTESPSGLAAPFTPGVFPGIGSNTPYNENTPSGQTLLDMRSAQSARPPYSGRGSGDVQEWVNWLGTTGNNNRGYNE